MNRHLSLDYWRLRCVCARALVQVAAAVRRGADYAAACVFADAASPCRGVPAVTFDQFGHFYNEYGFRKVLYTTYHVWCILQ
jgi:hypothetical protein